MKYTQEQLIKLDRLRLTRTGFGAGRWWQYRAKDNIYTETFSLKKAIREANKALQNSEVERR